MYIIHHAPPPPPFKDVGVSRKNHKRLNIYSMSNTAWYRFLKLAITFPSFLHWVFAAVIHVERVQYLSYC